MGTKRQISSTRSRARATVFVVIAFPAVITPHLHPSQHPQNTRVAESDATLANGKRELCWLLKVTPCSHHEKYFTLREHDATLANALCVFEGPETGFCDLRRTMLLRFPDKKCT